MKFNNKWDVLPAKEVNNRQREGRFDLYRREGILAKLAYLEKWPLLKAEDRLRAIGKGGRQKREKADDELEMRLM